MMKSLIILIVTIATGFTCLIAQEFSGSYFLKSEGTEIRIDLQNNGNGVYSGKMTGNGSSFALNGTVRNGKLAGAVGSEWDGIVFEAHLISGKLRFVMAEVDESGLAIAETRQSFEFHKGEGQTKPSEKESPQDGAVVINGTTLSNSQIAQLTETYGIKPLSGKYWYDSKSGLYGVVGYPAYGFMYPGHDFGQLSRDVSNGNTGVIVNNRELPQAEWAVWSYMLGYWIQMGSYWLDDKGNAGYQGNPLPLVNLYVAAQQNAYRGKGGSGDNFWSSRFGAGNYDSGNQRGYVSVPGHGPIGYGF